MPGATALLWLTAPLLTAAFLSRTGRLEAAHLLSAASFTGLVSFMAVQTGGLGAGLVAWLVLVPIEAAMSGSRRVVAWASAMAAGAVAALAAAAHLDMLPPAAPFLFGSLTLLLAPIFAVVYATALASGLHALQVRGSREAAVEDQRYRLLAEHATDLITRHTRSGNVVFASPGARHLLGLAPERLDADGLFHRVHVTDRPAYLKSFADAADHGHAEVRFRLRDERGGGFIWAEMRLTAVGDAEGCHGFVAVTRDVTAAKTYENALEAANAEASRAADAKARFLASVTHELRTPLNAVIGFSEMMTMDMGAPLSPEKTREYAQLINDSGRHLLDVVNGILDVSKLEAGSFEINCEPFDGRALLRNCIDMMRPAAAKASLAIEAEVETDGRELVADRRAVKQIYLNLISNAVKFTPAGGRIVAGLRLGRQGAELYVRDTGIGISAADLPRLGEPFVQAGGDRARSEGTGLGLSIVKGLAALHGGELILESVLGKGTTVTVALPPATVAGTVQPIERAAGETAAPADTRSRRVA